MYRADRFSRVNHVDRTPVVITLPAAMIVGVAIACVSRDASAKKPTTTPVVQPPVGGEVVNPTPIVQPPVTFASAQDA